jgi:NCS1 family nucleobase:cation symporter-1
MGFFIPSLTGMVGFWATVALNIPDFTRYAKSQKAQMWGQALGLPAAMTLYSFIGVAVTSASAVIFGEPIWDPVVLLGKFNQPVVASIALVALLIATLNTNVAANVVSPSNDFSNLNPKRISFRTGGIITGILGVAIMPWKLLGDFSAYIFGWLVGYSGLLGPIAGVMIADYFLVRHAELQVEDLAGIFVALIGLVFPPLDFLYKYAWFVGFIVSGAVYYALMEKQS